MVDLIARYRHYKTSVSSTYTAWKVAIFLGKRRATAGESPKIALHRNTLVVRKHRKFLVVITWAVITFGSGGGKYTDVEKLTRASTAK